ncbi:hypothetical protein [Wolbachia endosymbiont of Encarsia formosa]
MEYVAGDLYKLFLYDRAPIVELVINADLPIVVINLKKHIEQEKIKISFT